MNTPFDDRDPQGAQARLVDAIVAGGCNTCTRDSQKVWSIRGYGRQMEFRMCPACMDQLKQAVGSQTRRR